MAFTVSDVDDLIRILQEHPEWREKLRPIILGDELLAIPGRMDRVEAALERVVVAIEALTARMDAMEARLERVETRLDRIEGRLGNLEGQLLEARYQNHLGSWFGRWARRPRLLWPDDIGVFEAEEAGRLSFEEAFDVRNLDFVVGGADRAEPSAELVLAVEISYTINVEAVERARRRATILERLGFRSRPFVGGYRLSDAADARATQLGVIVDLRTLAA